MHPAPAVTVVELLRRQAALRPEALAYALGEERLGFGELLTDATRLAAGLADAGVRPGARVALVLPAGLDLARFYFAVLLAGGAPGLVAPTLSPLVLRRRVERLAPAAIVTDGETLAGSGERREGGPRLLQAPEVRARASGSTTLPAPAAADGVAHLQLTSGTSGEPRAAVLTQRAVTAYLRCAGEAYLLSPADRIVAWVPPWHDMGLFYGLLYPVAFGCPAFLVQPAIRTLGEWLATIARVRGTFTGAPDFAYRLACRLVSPAGLDLSSLRVATSGGEPVRRATIETFEARFGIPGRVRPAYGLAEASLGVSVAVSGPVRSHPSGAVSCGTPMPGVEVRIVRPDGGGAATGEPGEILVRSPSLFSGYLDAEEDTRRALRDGWLHTGDEGLLDERGELVVLGRRRNLLKRAGSSLAPRELEEVAETVPGVRLAAAVGEDERIFVVAEAGGGPEGAAATAAELAGALRAALGFQPEVVIVTPRTIPRSENGKVRHERLRAQLAAGLPADAVLFAAAGR